MTSHIISRVVSEDTHQVWKAKNAGGNRHLGNLSWDRNLKGMSHVGLHGSGSGLESKKLCILKGYHLVCKVKGKEDKKILYLEWNRTVPDGMSCINKFFLR